MFRRVFTLLSRRSSSSIKRSFATEQKKGSQNVIEHLQKQWQTYVALGTSVGYGILNVYQTIDQYREVPRVVDAIEKGSSVEDATNDSRIIRENDLIQRPNEVNQVKRLIKVGSEHSTLIGILCGQPGSGKSTIARKAIEESDKERVIVVRFDAGVVQGERAIVQKIAAAVNYTPFVPQEAKSNFSYWLNKISFSHKYREPTLLEMFAVLENVCTSFKTGKRPLFIFDNVEAAYQENDQFIKNLMGFAARGVVQDAWSVLFIVDEGPAANAIYSSNLAHHATANGVYVQEVSDEQGKAFFLRSVNERRKRRKAEPISEEKVNALIEKVTGGHIATIQRTIRDVQMLDDEDSVQKFIDTQIESSRPFFGRFSINKEHDPRSRGVWKMLFQLAENGGVMNKDEAWNIIAKELFSNQPYNGAKDKELKIVKTVDDAMQYLIDGKVIQSIDFNNKISFRTRKAKAFVEKVKNTANI